MFLALVDDRKGIPLPSLPSILLSLKDMVGWYRDEHRARLRPWYGEAIMWWPTLSKKNVTTRN